MSKRKVCITDYDFEDLSLEKSLLEPLGAEVVGLNVKKGDSLFEAAPDADVIMTQFAEIDRATMEKYAAIGKLRGICRYGIGVDVIDLAAANDNGIVVTNVPDYCTDEVADHTIAIGLMIIRRVPFYNKATHSGQWHWKSSNGIIANCRSMRWGFVGFGRIAQNVAIKLKAFGFSLQAHDPFVSEGFMNSCGVSGVSLEELFQTSDVISVMCNYTVKTHHIIDEAAFQLMKPTAIVINCARGKCIDNQALHRALSLGWIAAAGLDDIEEEPSKLNNWTPADNPLFQLENLIITPHIAYLSEKSQITMRLGAIENAKAMLLGITPPNVVASI